MTTAPVFRGSETEARDLLAAIQRHCTCARTDAGAGVRVGPPCDVCGLLLDQRALDHLAYARSQAVLWWRREFASDPREGDG